MENKFCSKCGAKLPEGDVKFCADCGQPVSGEAPKDDVQTDSLAALKADVEKIGSDIGKSVEELVKPETQKSIKEKFFCFEGRLNRKRYFWRSLLLTAIYTVCWMILGSGIGLGIGMRNHMLTAMAGLLMFVLAIPGIVAGVSLSVRRCHDLDKTGWLYLCALIPYVNFALSLYLLFARGTEGDNKYGKDIANTEGW